MTVLGEKETVPHDPGSTFVGTLVIMAAGIQTSEDGKDMS